MADIKLIKLKRKNLIYQETLIIISKAVNTNRYRKTVSIKTTQRASTRSTLRHFSLNSTNRLLVRLICSKKKTQLDNSSLFNSDYLKKKGLMTGSHRKLNRNYSLIKHPKGLLSYILRRVIATSNKKPGMRMLLSAKVS